MSVERIYPPSKLQDTKTVNGVKFNLRLLRSLWVGYLDRAEGKPLEPRKTKTRTVYPS
jgi:hypothetical protein